MYESYDAYDLEETMTQMDRDSLEFMDDPKNITEVQAFEIFADLLDVEEDDLMDFLNGKQFVPERKKMTNAVG